MSFASETKNELARMLPEKKCCMLADIAGFMRLAGSIRLVGGGRFEIVMMTSNLAVVRHYKTLIRNYFSVDIGIGVEQGNTLEKSSNYILSIGPEDRSEQILREAGILSGQGRNELYQRWDIRWDHQDQMLPEVISAGSISGIRYGEQPGKRLSF